MFLTVDANLAPVHVIEAQQQVDQRGFARAGTAHQTDFFARADGQAQAVEHLAFAVVVEVHVVEGHCAAGGHQHFCIRRILHLRAPGQGRHAILNGADVLEQRGHLPHDPVGHAVDPQRHGGNRRHRTGADLSLMPQPQRVTACGHDQCHHQGLVDDFELADQTHLAKTGLLEIFHRRPCEVRFAFGVGEQLHRGDVGVGVRDTPGHR
jgi:hypothetical protein